MRKAGVCDEPREIGRLPYPKASGAVIISQIPPVVGLVRPVLSACDSSRVKI